MLMEMLRWKVRKASVQVGATVIEAGETVAETAIDVTHAVIGTRPMLKTTVALEGTSTVEVGALAPDQDRLMVTDTTDPVAIDLAVMTMIGFEIGALAVTAMLSESVLLAPSANLLHLSPQKTSVIEGPSSCNSWLLD